MKKVICFLMVAMSFTFIQVSTAVAEDCSGMATPEDTAACDERQSTSGGADGGHHPPTGEDCNAMPTQVSKDACFERQSTGGVKADHAHAPVDTSHCADMPPTTRPACERQAHSGPPTGGVKGDHHEGGGADGHHDGGGADGHHDGGGADGHHDGPPIDPRTISDTNPTGSPFTPEDEAKYQVYADECESSGGTISAESLAFLISEGFTTEQVNGLCQMSAHDAAKDAACMPGTDGSVPPHCTAPAAQ